MRLQSYDYQPVVDMLVKLGNQLNRPNYRFLKGDVIAMAIEKATHGRLKYEDAVGYDSVDKVNGLKYEIKSVTKAFSKVQVNTTVFDSSIKEMITVRRLECW